MNTSPTSSSTESLYERYMAFPDISYADFLGLPEDLRREIIQKNRIVQTDTYNRTMAHVKGDEWRVPETYVLQMRRTADNGYLIASGIRNRLQKVFRMPILESELRFAKEFYAQANVPHFNETMWREVIDNHGGFPNINVTAVDDGTALLEADPVMRVSGPGELAAHFEPDMHRVFYETLVATTAHEIERKIGSKRFIEVGKRGTPNEEMHLQGAAAMYDGGGIFMTSNDAAAAMYPELIDVGTIGHRYIQFKDTEIEAFRAAIEKLDNVTILVDLTDSARGIESIINLKREFRNTGKKIWIRLDSGNLQQLATHTYKRYPECGFNDPVRDKTVIEDLNVVDDMVELDKVIAELGIDPKQFILYGAGGLLLTKKKERSNASTGYKLAGVGDRPKIKFSDSPGKESLPGWSQLVMKDGHRLIQQLGEFDDAESLMVPAYNYGRLLLSEDRAATRRRVQETMAQIDGMMGKRTPLSPETQRVKRALADHYGVTLA